MDFFVKLAIFSILKWNFKNINAVIAGLKLNTEFIGPCNLNFLSNQCVDF